MFQQVLPLARIPRKDKISNICALLAGWYSTRLVDVLASRSKKFQRCVPPWLLVGSFARNHFLKACSLSPGWCSGKSCHLPEFLARPKFQIYVLPSPVDVVLAWLMSWQVDQIFSKVCPPHGYLLDNLLEIIFSRHVVSRLVDVLESLATCQNSWQGQNFKYMWSPRRLM